MQIEVNQVYNRDCLAGMRSLDDGCVPLAFADPPFNIGYDYDVYDDRKPRDRYLDWTREWVAQVVRVLTPTGTFWLAIGDEYAAEAKLIAQSLGLTCRSWVIWYYTFGVHCKRKFTRSHAHLFHFVRDPKRFTFNAAAIRVPSARQLVYADGRANPDGRVPDDTWILRPQDVPRGFRGEEDTWYYPRVCGTFRQRARWHSCQMPERVLERIIRVSSNPGELVLDPFAGSGTTLAVAKKLHRAWIGFEISRAYARRARERLDRINPGDPIDGPENPFGTAPPTQAGRRLGERPAGRTPGHAIGTQHARATPVRQRVSCCPAQVVPAHRELDAAILEAYRAASDGYSIDRMLADPRLSTEFQKACRELGVPGEAGEWKRRLLGLRKAGGLRALATPRRTVISWAELEQFAFASELAWQIVAHDSEEASLDDILCDDALAQRFDATAERFAPGWTPFHYRWGALTVRKLAGRLSKKVETAALDRLSECLRRTQSRLQDLGCVPDVPGLYILQTGSVSLYLGETSALGKRLAMHGKHLAYLLQALPVETGNTQDVSIGIYASVGDDEKRRRTLYVNLVPKLCTLGNHNPRRRAS